MRLAAAPLGIALITLNMFRADIAPTEKILVHGHRGARARRPENTLPAFRYAIQAGVDALEMDMAVTKDNVIVISHDPVLRPLTPEPGEFVRLVLAKVREYHLEKRVILQSFDFRTLLAMRKLAPEIRLSALVEKDTRPFPQIAAEGKADIISPHYSLVSPEKVKEAHSAGIQVVAWTANTPADWDLLISAQVDAIISDDPAELITYLKKKGLRQD